jgi:hypothetical protein
MHFLLPFQEVMLISKTRNQLRVIFDLPHLVFAKPQRLPVSRSREVRGGMSYQWNAYRGRS